MKLSQLEKNPINFILYNLYIGYKPVKDDNRPIHFKFPRHSKQQWPPTLSDLLNDLILASDVIWIPAMTSFSRNFY